MRRAEFVDRVRALGGFSSTSEAEGAVEATLDALGAVLVPSERRAVADELSAELGAWLQSEDHCPDLDVDGFYQRVQEHERLPPGRAQEHAQVVCRALTEAARPEVMRLLRRHLPRFADLFEPPAHPTPPSEPERHGTFVDGDRTLAGGRPGSRQPVSEARPQTAHAHSVARADEPHAETKLSSSKGLTQEREGETISRGKPGPKRSVSG